MDDSSPCQVPLRAVLTYDDVEHAYTLNGDVVPSVTAIISDVMNAGKKPRYPAGVGERGRLVHTTCEYDDAGVLNEDDLDPVLAGFLAGWRGFKAEYEPRWLAIEGRVASVRHRYAGTMDRLADIGGHVTLLDIKSGAQKPEHTLQTAGYALAYEEATGIHVARRMCVYIWRTGEYEVKWHPERERDRAAFLGARALYEWRNGW